MGFFDFDVFDLTDPHNPVAYAIFRDVTDDNKWDDEDDEYDEDDWLD